MFRRRRVRHGTEVSHAPRRRGTPFASRLGSSSPLNHRSFHLEPMEERRMLAVDPLMFDVALVKDINPSGSSSPAESVNVGGILYFAASDGTNGRELWRSDGTEAGTAMLGNINSGAGDSDPQNLVNVGGTLYFTADDGFRGRELWKSDGTPAGTEIVKDIEFGPLGSAPTSLVNVGGTLYFGAGDTTNGYELWKSDGTEAGTVLVKDIRPGGQSSVPNHLTNVGGILYFNAFVGANGFELWKSDGTEGGTVLVKDIAPDFESSDPTHLTNVGGILYFAAGDTTNGFELWKSDGTEGGTVRVKDINPGISSSNPSNLTNVGGILYFTADDGTNGTELWKSDGTEAGTVQVKDINISSFSSNPSNLTNVGGILYFAADDLVNGTELWKSDGTGAGTVRVKNINASIMGSSNPSELTNVAGLLYFSADDGTNGVELWVSDGTEIGTVLVKNISPGGGNSNPSQLTNVRGALYFSANDGTNGIELWKLDVIDTLPPQRPTLDLLTAFDTGSATNDDITNLAVLDFRLSAELGTTVHIKDGETIIHTIDDFTPDADGFLVVTIDFNTVFADFGIPVEGPHPLSAEAFDYAGNRSAQSEVVPLLIDTTEPLVGDPALYILSSSVTDVCLDDDVIQTSINEPAFSGYVEALSTVRLYALNLDDPSAQPVLIGVGQAGSDESDGTPGDGLGIWEITVEPLADATYAITMQVEDSAGNITSYTHGGQPNTVLVKDINPSPGTGSSPEFLVNVGGILYFSATDGTNGFELWKSDGTEAGTLLVKDINPNPITGSSPEFLVNVGGILYFSATDGTNGRELWKSDGTEAGTLLVKDINPNPNTGSNPSSLVNVGGILYFSATDGTNGYELWKSDGTEAGTVLVKDIVAGAGNSNPQYLTNVGGILYFSAFDTTNGYELWKSDGTEAGTVLVKDINPNTGSSPSSLANVGGILYFSAHDGTNGFELWKSDGTEAGTVLVKDINPNPNTGSNPSSLANVGGILYFSANDGTNGFELWKHDERLIITIDTLAPQRPTLDLLAAFDTGWATNDDITRLTSLDFRLSAEPGSHVVIKDGEVVILEIPNFTPDADGFLIVTVDFNTVFADFGIPVEGPHPLSAEAFDCAGNRSAQSEVLPLLIDTTAPTWTSIEVLNAVVDGPNLYTNVNPITFEGSATAGAIVRFYSNGDLVGEAYVGDDESDGNPNDGFGVFTVTLAPLADGQPNLTIQVEDLAGNLDDTDEVFPNLILDTLAPQRPTIDLLAADDTGFSNDDDFTRLTVLRFRISAEAGSDVVIKDGNTVIATIDNIVLDSDGFATVTLDFVANQINHGIPAEGPHPLSIESTDTAGNRSAQSAVLPLVIDRTAPTWTSLELLNAIADGPNLYTRINPITIEGHATALALVRIYTDNGSDLIGEAYVGDDDSDGIPGDGFGVFTVTLAPLVDGSYAFQIEIEDRAGNLDGPDDIFTNTILDTLPPQRPTIDLITPDDTGSFDNDDITNLSTLTFRISAEPGSDVVIKDGDTVIVTLNDLVVGPDGFTTVVIDFANIPNFATEGPHPLSIESTDTAGNRSAQSAVLPLVIDLTDPILSDNPIFILASSVTDICLDDDVTQTSVNEPAFSGYVEALAIVRLYARNVDDPDSVPQLIGIGQAGSDESDGDPADGYGIWEITVEPLADGNYEITMQVEDVAGNITPWPDPDGDGLFIKIDTLAPQRPTIDLVNIYDTGSSDLDNVTNLWWLDFRISAEPGSRVLIKDGEVVIYEIDHFIPGPDGFAIVSIDFFWEEFEHFISAEGPHPLSVEAFDCAGNRSAQSEELLVEIDLTAPCAVTADMLSSSDSGTFDDDNVTNIRTPAFSGYAEANATIRIYASPVINGVVGAPELVGVGRVGSDESDGRPWDGLGIWEVTIEPLDDGQYIITTEVEDLAGNVGYCEDDYDCGGGGGGPAFAPAGEGGWGCCCDCYCDCEPLTIYIDTLVPNTPYLDLVASSDTGRHNADNVTFDITPTFTITADDLPGNVSIDPNAIVNPFWHDVVWRLFARRGDTPEVLVASLNSLSELGHFVTTLDLPAFFGTNPGDVDGVYNFKLEVEDRAGNISPDFLLQVTFDTIAPIPAGDLHPNSDSGVTGYTPTFGDKVTNVKTPSFFGSAEANVFVDLLIDGVPAGGSVSVPLDGNFAFLLNGEFYTQSNLNLQDGLHTAIFIHEDLAGNKQSFTRLFFVDTQGPRITNVVRGQVSYDGVLDFDGVNSLFAPKPQSNVDPLIHSIVVNFLDNPPRVQQFLYEAVFAALASQPGNYTLIGDRTGYVTIVQAIPTFTTIAGVPALASVELVFSEPLADDRYTFSVSQNLRDPAGNALDGESSAAGPFAGNPAPQDTPPFFPTGDGSPGGGFVSRFTVDSRPELGTYASTTIYLDINGNAIWDPQGQNNDRTNVDLTFLFGNPSSPNDSRFAGKFSPLVNGVKTLTDGFDKLAAYGNFGGTFRWLIDTNSDGVPDLNLVDAFQKDGIPIAGNFDGNKANGDEIGYFTGDKWYLDTNGDYILDTVITSALRGFPIVGDFDGDGYDDLATYAADRFQFDFYANGGWNGVIEDTILWGFDGVVERPVAADMDADGVDDIGLWVPGRSGQLPRVAAEWFFLVSGRDPIPSQPANGVAPANVYYGTANWLKHAFSPVPFGNDLFFQFGDEFAIPIIGNFDPPNDPLTDNFAFLPFEDSFDRADSTNLGPKWVERLGNVRIASGELVLHNNATSIAALNGVTATDVSVEAVIDVTNGSSVGLLARYGGSGDSNAYMGLLVKTGSGYAAQIWRNVGGTWTNLTSQSVGRGQGTLRFEVVGTSLRLLFNGQTVGQATDGVLTTGGGVGLRHSGGKVASFKAETQLLPFRAATALPFVDDFARANSTSLGVNWQELEGDIGISNGAAVLYRNATSVATLVDVAVADVVVSADIDITGGGNAGLLARHSGPGDSNGYMARLYRGDAFYAAQIWRNVDGQYVPLRSVPVSGGAGNLRFEVIGSELKLYFNGQLVASTIDTYITGAGSAGIRHSGGKLDNFQVERATAPTALAASLPFADAFTRNDNSLLAADWVTRAGDFRIFGGKVNIGAGETSIAVLNGAVQANVSVVAEIDVTAGGNIGLLARYSGPGDSNAYMGRLVTSGGRYYAQIWKNLGGNWTYLTHAEVASGSGTLRFDVVGNSLKLYFDGLLVGDTVDASITAAGQVGFRHSGGTLDNFSAQ
ncbi:MAG: hypothetical protein KF708_06075 [Pirellulales bacterium]|nr:hypothetical protein [Pirellulales bacterium]